MAGRTATGCGLTGGARGGTSGEYIALLWDSPPRPYRDLSLGGVAMPPYQSFSSLTTPASTGTGYSPEKHAWQ